MKAEGIPLGVGYPEPLSRQDVITSRIAYLRDKLGLPSSPTPDCPVSKEVCARGLWLPQYVLLGSQADMDDIVRAVHKIQDAWNG